ERKQRIAALLARATELEQTFLRRLIIGELRQGALDAVVVEAIAQAIVADAALADGPAGVGRFQLTVFRPVLPMLAQSADDAGLAVAGFGGEALLETKL